MRYMKWIGLAAVILLILGCFMEWVHIVSIDKSISGVDSNGLEYGKPGYFHFFMSIFFVAFTLIPRVWAKRVNLLIVSLNIAWAIRNYFILGVCAAGECPERKMGLYLVTIASFIMFVSALFPDVELKDKPVE